jgi:hypothetical protein
MLRLVRGHIIDGERWIAERLKFLREQLEEGPSDEARGAIEAEIQALSKERGVAPGGRRASLTSRWLHRRSTR